MYVLEELGLTYHTVYLDLHKGENRAPAFTAINPNGRIPALVDHAAATSSSGALRRPRPRRAVECAPRCVSAD